MHCVSFEFKKSLSLRRDCSGFLFDFIFWNEILILINETYPELPLATKVKFTRVESNFMYFERIDHASNRQKSVCMVYDNEKGELNTLAYFEPNSSQ